jgi:hypothetical protein
MPVAMEELNAGKERSKIDLWTFVIVLLEVTRSPR